MKVSTLSDAIAYSNRMVEKLAKKIINESSNAVLLEMFENKVLLADHTNENIDLNNFVQNFQARIENTLNDKRIEKQKEFIKNLSIKDKQIQNREPQRER